MNPRVVSVRALPEFNLELVFANGEVRLFQAGRYLAETPALGRILNPAVFAKAYVTHGTVAWSDEEDLCPDTLYLQSHPVANKAAA